MADPEKLKSEDKVQLTPLLETGEKYAKFFELAQPFRVILKEGRIKEWGGCLVEAKGCGIIELLKFDNGLERDEKAVKNAVMSDLSNGQTEGQVNRLKVIKRQNNIKIIRLTEAPFDTRNLRAIRSLETDSNNRG